MLAQDRIPPQIGDYVKATTLDQALAALADGQATVLAGGSDLWAQKDSGNGRIRTRLVNVNRVNKLTGIEEAGGRLRLGACTTMTEILESPLLADKAPLLPATADRFASPQIRNVATIGGNIANASPAADMVLALIALGAEVELASARGMRTLVLEEIFTGPGQTVIAPDELIVAVEFAMPGASAHGVFCKSGPRPALEISQVAMALTGTRRDGALTGPCIVFGSVGPKPMRCRKTEALIDGKPLDDALIAAALDQMATEIAPIDDVRASAWYRTHVARTFLEQELQACR